MSDGVWMTRDTANECEKYDQHVRLKDIRPMEASLGDDCFHCDISLACSKTADAIIDTVMPDLKKFSKIITGKACA